MAKRDCVKHSKSDSEWIYRVVGKKKGCTRNMTTTPHLTCIAPYRWLKPIPFFETPLDPQYA
jgi:hypothetical protein